MLKNLTNFFTLGGDYFLYGRTYKLNVWGCVALMALSALCGAVTDLAFDARGYFWQMVNCLFTAGALLCVLGWPGWHARWSARGPVPVWLVHPGCMLYVPTRPCTPTRYCSWPGTAARSCGNVA